MRQLLPILLLLTLVLCGCHGRVEHDLFELPESFDAKKQYEITFWAKNENNQTQRDIYAAAVKGFEDIYPNIKVTLVSYTDYGKIRSDVLTNLSTNTTPNVCITYPDHVAEYMQGDNVIVPLDELMIDPRYGLGGSEVRFNAPGRDEIIKKFLDECRIDGRCMALPFMRSTEACYVNKDFVEALGYTLPEVLSWDFVFEVSNAAMAKNPDGTFKLNGQKTLIPFIYKSTDNMMISMLRQKDAPYSNEGGEILMFNDMARELLFTVSEHAKSRAFSTFKISSYPANFLNAGQCIFAVDSTAGSTWMGSKAPLCDISEENLVDFETAVMPIPQFDTQNPMMISQGPSVCIFNKDDTGEVLASWLFLQYLLSNEVQIAYSSTEGYVPVTKTAQDAAEYQDYLARRGEDNSLYYDVKIDATKLLIKHTENTFTTPVFSGSASLRDAAGQMIENVTKSARRGETVDDAYIEKLYKDMTALYRLDGVNGGMAGTSQIKASFGALPKTAVILLVSLALAWVLIIAYFVCETIKKRKK